MAFQHRVDAGVIVAWRLFDTKKLHDFLWAADTGCFKHPDGFDRAKYLAWLDGKREFVNNCLFATAPDIVGDAEETWRRSEPVLPLIRELGYPAALVAQDGIEDMSIEWDAFDALFIGGTTEWKLSEVALQLVAAANARGKHTHMGRVNSWKRLRLAALAGCDSTDGTRGVYAPTKALPEILGWLRKFETEPPMDLYHISLCG